MFKKKTHHKQTACSGIILKRGHGVDLAGNDIEKSVAQIEQWKTIIDSYNTILARLSVKLSTATPQEAVNITMQMRDIQSKVAALTSKIEEVKKQLNISSNDTHAEIWGPILGFVSTLLTGSGMYLIFGTSYGKTICTRISLGDVSMIKNDVYVVDFSNLKERVQALKDWAYKKVVMYSIKNLYEFIKDPQSNLDFYIETAIEQGEILIDAVRELSTTDPEFQQILNSIETVDFANAAIKIESYLGSSTRNIPDMFTKTLAFIDSSDQTVQKLVTLFENAKTLKAVELPILSNVVNKIKGTYSIIDKTKNVAKVFTEKIEEIGDFFDTMLDFWGPVVSSTEQVNSAGVGQAITGQTLTDTITPDTIIKIEASPEIANVTRGSFLWNSISVVSSGVLNIASRLGGVFTGPDAKQALLDAGRDKGLIPKEINIEAARINDQNDRTENEFDGKFSRSIPV